MNIKKWVVTFSAVLMGAAVFAQTVPQDANNPEQAAQIAQLLEQYQAEQAKLNKQFDEQLLVPVRTFIDAILILQRSGQEEIPPAQEKELETYSQNIDNVLNALVAPVVKDLDMAQLNAQYQDMMKQMGMEDVPTLTKEAVTEMYKGIYLLSALAHFEETKKLTTEQLNVAMALFLPQPEEEQVAQ